MSTITIRTHQSIGGRATCPCGWTITGTKRGAYEAARTHNETNHSGNYMVHVAYTITEETL